MLINRFPLAMEKDIGSGGSNHRNQRLRME